MQKEACLSEGVLPPKSSRKYYYWLILKTQNSPQKWKVTTYKTEKRRTPSPFSAEVVQISIQNIEMCKTCDLSLPAFLHRITVTHKQFLNSEVLRHHFWTWKLILSSYSQFFRFHILQNEKSKNDSNQNAVISMELSFSHQLQVTMQLFSANFSCAYRCYKR